VMDPVCNWGYGVSLIGVGTSAFLRSGQVMESGK
jgi:protein-disulfide isomerase-like protein with CxxC motif